MMSAVHWFDRSIHAKLSKAGEDAALRSVSTGRMVRGSVRLPGGLGAILANPPGAMFVVAAPTRLRKASLVQGVEDHSVFAKITGNTVDQRGATRALERQSEIVRSSRKTLGAIAAPLLQRGHQSIEQEMFQKPKSLSLFSLVTSRTETLRSHTQSGNAEGATDGGTRQPHSVGGTSLLASPMFRSAAVESEAFSKGQPGTAAALVSTLSSGSRSSAVSPLPAAARGDYSDTARLAPAPALSDVSEVLTVKAGLPGKGIFSKAVEQSISKDSKPGSLSSFALEIVPRGVAPGSPREANSSATFAAGSRFVPTSRDPVGGTVPLRQSGTPFDQKAPSAGHQAGSVVALRGDVVMDGRKMGRLVAVGQVSVASLPGVSSSAVNLKAMPVFAGTSVPL